MKFLNYEVYESLHDLPVQNYFNYYKYNLMVNALYFDHNKMIEIFKSTGNKDALAKQERNKRNMEHINSTGLNIVLLCFLCLTDTKKFNNSYLHKLSKDIQESDYEAIYSEYKRINKHFKNELGESKLIEGGLLSDDLETFVSREEFITYSELKNSLLRGMKAGFDMDIYNKAIADAFSVVDASEVERNVAPDMNRNLMILRREGYYINTAYDYLLACKVLSESVSKNTT